MYVLFVLNSYYLIKLSQLHFINKNTQTFVWEILVKWKLLFRYYTLHLATNNQTQFQHSFFLILSYECIIVMVLCCQNLVLKIKFLLNFCFTKLYIKDFPKKILARIYSLNQFPHIQLLNNVYRDKGQLLHFVCFFGWVARKVIR